MRKSSPHSKARRENSPRRGEGHQHAKNSKRDQIKWLHEWNVLYLAT